MNPVEPLTNRCSTDGRQSNSTSSRLTIRGSLSLAFGVLFGLTLLVCSLAWLLYDELALDLEMMSTQLIPHVVQSRNLAMANNSLASLAGKMAEADTPEELSRQAEFGRLASERLHQALNDAVGQFDPGQMQELKQINRQLAATLEQLNTAVKQQFELRERVEEKKKQVQQAIDSAVVPIEQSILTLAEQGLFQQVRLYMQCVKFIREAEWLLRAPQPTKSQKDIEALIAGIKHLNEERQALFGQLEQAGLENYLLQALSSSGWSQSEFLQLHRRLLELNNNVKTLVGSSRLLSAQFRLLTTVVIKHSSEQVEQMRQAALQEIAGRKQLMVVVVLSCLGCAALSIWYFGHRRMALPLVLLSRAVRAFERGDAEVVSTQAGVREVRELSESFNQMTETLSNRDRELQRLHLLLRNVIDSLSPVLLAVDQDLRLKLWNLQAEKIFDREKLAVGHSAIDVLGWLPLKEDQLEQSIAKGEPLLLKNLRVEHEDEPRVYEFGCTPLIAAHSRGAVLRVEDVTERLRFERAIAQSEKLLSVGSLAAGIAHEINNPLAAIMQYAQVLENRLSPSLPANSKTAEGCGFTMAALDSYLEQRGIKPMLGGIRSSVNQTAKIVKKMQVFGRSSSVVDGLSYEQVDMVALLEDTLALMSSDYDLRQGYDFRRIEIRRNLAKSLPRISCDPSLIQQVLFNVLKNCAQMFGAGEDEQAGACISLTLLQEGEQLKLSVQDNGPGMPEEVRRRIFEPFVTAREVGRGAGLGMSVAYFIITDFHRGRIEVTSSPGNGCRFDIWLPLEQPKPEPFQ